MTSLNWPSALSTMRDGWGFFALFDEKSGNGGL
jgi:hypothetical protein